MWTLPTRIAFRFFFVYFSLYCLATQIIGGLLVFPGVSFPGFGTAWPMRAITIWIATRLGVTSPLVYSGNSGDTAFYWVQTLWLLLLAAVITIVWSDLDRRRTEYQTLQKWFRLFIRFALAAQMFSYGLAKVIPTQFPAPSLVTLVEPVGHLSLTDLLWITIGASTSYQVFTGIAELASGLLLILPRTTMAGALIGLADMVLVLALNMTYDFGLKQISFHLILLMLFLLAPDLERLRIAFFTKKTAPAPHHPPLFASAHANRTAAVAQVVYGLFLIAMFTRISASYWYGPGGGGAPKSPLYGIWNVEELIVDGEPREPASNDYDRRWRRVIFDAPDTMVFQRTDDSFAHYGAAIDTSRGSIVLTKGRRTSWSARFAFERPASDRLMLDGEMDALKIRARLQRVEFDTFRLLNSTFRFVRPSDQFGN